MITHTLMIKTHIETGLKYFCYSRRNINELYEYTGSGTYWLNHLKVHGKNISTKIVFSSINHDEAKIFAINKSIEWNIVESKDWANLILEDANSGSYLFKWSDKSKSDFSNREFSQEHKENLSKSSKNKPKSITHRKSISNIVTEHWNIKRLTNNTNHTKEHCENISKSKLGSLNPNYGKIWITNGKDNKLVYNNFIIPEFWNKGRTVR